MSFWPEPLAHSHPSVPGILSDSAWMSLPNNLMMGIKPRALYMLHKHSSPELHLQVSSVTPVGK